LFYENKLKELFMKRLLFVLILIVWSSLIFCQTEMGAYLIKARTNVSALFGNDKLEFNGKSVKSGESTNISFYPSVGNFLLKNLAVGISLPIQYSKTISDDETQITTSINISPFVQYVFGKDNFKPYLIFSGGYNYMTMEVSNLNFWDKEYYSGLSFEGGIGALYFINDNISWDIEFAYEKGGLSYGSDPDYKYKFSYFKILSGFSFVLD
jgi:hypothetical protein